MIAIDEAYAELKTFFAENPDGTPPGGWAQGSTSQSASGDADGMDW